MESHGMNRISKLPSRLAFLASMFILVGVLGATAPPHFDLEKSTPEADATVHEIEAVTLWFTQEPAEGSVSVRLIDASGEPMEGFEAKAHEDDAKVFAVATPDGLAPGKYTVSWRGIGADGHVVRGDFAFTMMAH
jgi:methionine-rich copper-binding protein CopC